MSILLFSDLHVHPHKKSVERLHHCLDALEWVFRTAKERQISDVVFGGDLFQDRQKIDVMTYHLTFDVLARNCSNDLRLWLLLGNHDLWYHDKWDISSVRPFSAIPGTTVIEKPCSIEIDGHIIDFLPYTHHPVEHLDTLRKAAKKRKGRKTLVAHLAVDGAQLNTLHNTRSDVVIEHDGEMVRVDHTCFDGWDKVWLGHYHGQQKVGLNAEYIGSTLQLTFGEAFQHKHIIVYDLKDGTTEYIRNKFSPQHFIIPESDIGKYDIENNFIRLSVSDMGGTVLVDLKKELQEFNPGSLEILPLVKEESEHLVEDAKAILYKEDEMLEKYVEQVEVGKLDKKVLLEIGKKICQAPADT
jgi:DNA repair exonuclease SbcCD nuclease subunit